MAWSWAKKDGESGDAWSLEQPASKRRKLAIEKRQKQQKEISEEGKDEWDDSLELTQADLDEMDVMVSQAADGQNRIRSSETERKSPAAGSSFLMPAQPVRSVIRTSTSSSDSSLIPISLSSRSSSETSTNLSLSSHSSSNGLLDKQSEAVQSLQAKLDLEVKRAQDEKYRSEGEVKFLRESINRQKEDLDKLRAKLTTAQEEQKKVESERERQLQLQLDSLTSEAQFKERELTEENQRLIQKLRSLEQQMKQLPPQELTAGNLASSVTASPIRSSPRKVPVRPSPPSKAKSLEHRLKKGDQDDSSSQQAGFPTALSFMEQGPKSDVLSSPAAARLASSNVSCQTDKGVMQNVDLRSSTKACELQQRRVPLKVHAPKGGVRGPQLVSQLLQASVTSRVHGNTGHDSLQWDPGLTGLLHTMSTSLMLAGLTYGRGRESSFLSPLKPKRLDVSMRSPGSGESLYQVVSREHFRLAIEGLTILLDPSSIYSEQLKDLKNKGWLKDLHSSTLENRTFTSEHTSHKDNEKDMEPQTSALVVGIDLPDNGNTSGPSLSQGLPQRQLSAAIMLFPLLTDYIRHYVDILQSGAKHVSEATAPTTPKLMKSMSSLDGSRSLGDSSSCYSSSLDSLSSCVLQLLQDGRVYAASIEGYTLSALRILSLLLNMCPAVGRAFMQSVTLGNTVDGATTSLSYACDDKQEELCSKKTASGTDADDERSTSSSDVRVTVGHQTSSLHGGQDKKDNTLLMHMILWLASQDLEDSATNLQVVQEALAFLTSLCTCCNDEQLLRLDVILTRGILSSCLKSSSNVQVTLWTLKLISALTSSHTLLRKLCSKCENCPLYFMHLVCSRKNSENNEQNWAVVYKEYISCLSIILFRHRSNLSCMIGNSCRCSMELVVSVIIAMDKLYSLLLACKHADSQHQRMSYLNTLAQGVTLIHTLAQADNLFAQHHSAVRLQYIHLVSGLTTVMRDNRDMWEFHLSALDELSDFEPELGDQLQEPEDRMDLS